MSVQLSQPDSQELVGIVSSLSDFASVRDRRRLVEGALGSEPNANIILSRLDLDGTPMGTAVGVIRELAQFGQVAYGKEALGVFLNYIQPFTGDEGSAFISRLFATYPLDAQASPSHAIDQWRGRDSVEDVQEKIIGENTLRHVRMLELAFEAAKAVVHLRVPGGSGGHVGTGFMVASDLLMTNNHVIESREEGEATEYTFNYQLDRRGNECPTLLVSALAGGLYHTNKDLDYTIVQLAEVPDFGEPLAIQSVQVRRDDRVSIIQHPGGHLKQISIQNNFVAYADKRAVQYTTSTMPGSSGSPVFNDEFEVIAIHHSGGMLLEPSTKRRYLRNEGTSMIAVLNDLKANAQEIHELLKG